MNTIGTIVDQSEGHPINQVITANYTASVNFATIAVMMWELPSTQSATCNCPVCLQPPVLGTCSQGILIYTQPITVPEPRNPHQQTHSFNGGQNCHCQTPRQVWTKENKNKNQQRPPWSSAAFSEEIKQLNQDKSLSK